MHWGFLTVMLNRRGYGLFLDPFALPRTIFCCTKCYLVTPAFKTPGKVNDLRNFCEKRSIRQWHIALPWSFLSWPLLQARSPQMSPLCPQMLFRCLRNAPQMLSKCFPNVSQITCPMISPLGFLFPDFSFMILPVGWNKNCLGSHSGVTLGSCSSGDKAKKAPNDKSVFRKNWGWY